MPSQFSCLRSFGTSLLAVLALTQFSQVIAKNTDLKPGQSGATKAKPGQAKKWRLPNSSIPIEYELSFTPDLVKFTFTGSESLKIQVKKKTREIVLNALTLKVRSAEISSLADGKPAGAAQTLEIKPEAETEKVRLIAKADLAPGTYIINCKFEGTLNNELRGFYRAGYEDDAHKKHWLAATQMEATDARRMFPCYDEPDYKAVFKIKAKIDKNYTAISNAPIALEKVEGDKKTVEFEPSPKMSSYLLALIVGDLKCSGETTGGSVPIKVWAVSGKEQLGKYALSEAGKILDYETKYFGLPYIGKKLDLIALPEFNAGAMENIGAITFTDSALLVDDKTGSSNDRQDITGTMAHEMAHQWFGDLVTMKWWDDLWLNEAFASWMTTKVVEALHPEWREMTRSFEGKNWSMSTDALKSTRAIHATVENPSQATEMFDGITYTKGAAVLRMLETFVGADKYQHGINKYLQAHSFANATAADFWTAIAAEANGVPVAELMKSFVFQPGFPQVNVKSADNLQAVSFSQYRQLLMGQDKQDPSLWLIPLVIRSLGEKDAAVVSKILRTREEKLSLASLKQPFLVNAGGTGYFRVCYESKHLKELQSRFAELTAEEKLMLLDDCSSLVLPGDIPIEDIFNFIHLMKGENDPIILESLTGIADGATEYLRDTANKKDFEHWVQHTLAPLREKLDGWKQKDDDSEQTKQLRASVLRQLGTYGQEKRTIDEALSLFDKYAKDRHSVNPDLVETVFSIVAFNGGAKQYDEMVRLYKNASNPSDASTALFALCRFHQADLAQKTLTMGMGKDLKKSVDGLHLITGIAFNHYTRDIGWSFIKQHWNEIMHKFPPEMLTSLGGLCRAYDTPEKEKEFIQWYAAHPVPYSKAKTARALESMHTGVLYRQRYAERIRKWVVAANAAAGK